MFMERVAPARPLGKKTCRRLWRQVGFALAESAFRTICVSVSNCQQPVQTIINISDWSRLLHSTWSQQLRRSDDRILIAAMLLQQCPNLLHIYVSIATSILEDVPSLITNTHEAREGTRRLRVCDLLSITITSLPVLKTYKKPTNQTWIWVVDPEKWMGSTRPAVEHLHIYAVDMDTVVPHISELWMESRTGVRVESRLPQIFDVCYFAGISGLRGLTQTLVSCK